MKITSRTVTTRCHEATITPDEIKAVAVLAVQRQLGLSSDAVVSSDTETAEDGSIHVVVVEAVSEQPVAKPADDQADGKFAAAPIAAVAPSIPLSIVTPTA